jgi:hypothetical protein
VNSFAISEMSTFRCGLTLNLVWCMLKGHGMSPSLVLVGKNACSGVTLYTIFPMFAILRKYFNAGFDNAVFSGKATVALQEEQI